MKNGKDNQVSSEAKDAKLEPKAHVKSEPKVEIKAKTKEAPKVASKKVKEEKIKEKKNLGRRFKAKKHAQRIQKEKEKLSDEDTWESDIEEKSFVSNFKRGAHRDGAFHDEPPASSSSQITDLLDDISKDIHEVLIKAPLENGCGAEEVTRVIKNTVHGGEDIHPISFEKLPKFGRQVSPGHIRPYFSKGRIRIADEGFWRLMSINNKWHAQEYDLKDDEISVGTFNKIDVKPGEIGLAELNNKQILLGEGIHVYNTSLFMFLNKVQRNQEHFQHGNFHMMLIKDDRYGLVTHRGVQKIIAPGEYFVESDQFEFNGTAPINQRHVQHGNCHIILVPKGKIGLVTVNSTPMMLDQGTHRFTAAAFKFDGLKKINSVAITNGTITYYRVRKGQVGLAWNSEGHPEFIEDPGYYKADSSTFEFVGVEPATKQHISLGSEHRINITPGEVGVLYNDGKLEVLPPGTVRKSGERIEFKGTLSTLKQPIRLHPSSGYLECRTSEMVQLDLRANLYYRIPDAQAAEVALTKIGKDQETILSRLNNSATTIITNIIRSINFQGMLKDVEDEGASHKNDSPISGTMVNDIRDAVLTQLHHEMKDTGVIIEDLKMTEFKIHDPKLRSQIEKFFTTKSAQERELETLALTRKIEVESAQRTTQLREIEAQAKYMETVKKSEAAAKAALAQHETALQRVEIEEKTAEVEARTMKLRAQAEADAMLIKAEAQAQQGKKQVEVERARAEIFQDNPLMFQFEAIKVGAEETAKAFGNVEKVVYMPTDTKLSDLVVTGAYRGLVRDMLDTDEQAPVPTLTHRATLKQVKNG